MAEKIPKSKIYTRQGDRGESSLYNGARTFKHDDVFAALGDVDETSSAIGVARAHCVTLAPELVKELDEVMSRLMDIGSAIATPRASSPENLIAKTRFSEANLAHLESTIDSLDYQLPALKNFILPTGGHAAAALHHARTVCRRAERRVSALQDDLEHAVLAYLNRLSDFLFVAARFAAHKSGAQDVIYKPCSQPK